MPSNIVRAKGLVWSAAHNEYCILFSQAGPSVNIEPVAYWVAALPEARQKEILSEDPEIAADWDVEFGDRMTKLVIIGTNLDQEAITKELDQCLLTTEEFNDSWEKIEDPFGWIIES